MLSLSCQLGKLGPLHVLLLGLIQGSWGGQQILFESGYHHYPSHFQKTAQAELILIEYQVVVLCLHHLC